MTAIARITIVVGAAFIFVQPLDVRFWGLSGLTMFVAVVAFALLLRLATSPSHAVFLALFALPLVAFLLITDVMLAGAYRGSQLAVSLALVAAVILQPPGRHGGPTVSTIWYSLLVAASALAVIAVWRYLFGHPIPGSENPLGVTALVGRYSYLAIGYMPATRNADVFYLLLGLFAAGGVNVTAERTWRTVSWLAVVGFAILTILTLSRGAALAVVTYLLVFMGLRRFGAIIFAVAATAGALYLLLPSAGDNPLTSWVLRLIQAMALSLVDVNAADSSLSGVYSFSNASRFDIAGRTLAGVLAWPFGFGVDNPLASGLNPATTRTHSESLYLDWLVIFGVLGLPAAAAFVLRLVRMLVTAGRTALGRASAAMLLSLAVYASVNSVIDFTVFWVVLAAVVYSLRVAEIQARCHVQTVPESQMRVAAKP